ncbi:MAG: hypothetical protein RLZZ511_402 [Cyanobacteriota bacterium]|jgi:hypothetical protein
MLNPLSFVPIKIKMYYFRPDLEIDGEIVNTELAIGTAFLYLFQEKTYLITNWHNVTGRRADDHTIISRRSAIPNFIRAKVPYVTCTCENGKISVRWIEHSICLYQDSLLDLPQHSLWYEHQAYRSKVDVAVIPMESNPDLLPENSIWHGREYPLKTIIQYSEDSPKLAVCSANHPGLGLQNLLLEPGLDVFILGFPIGMSGGAEFSVWKRGSIASEPSLDVDQLPKILIDTATRKGMSGSPVYAVPRFPYSMLEDQDENGTYKQFMGMAERLIGIYSGRVGMGAFKAQLGVVWKTSVIDEIIEGATVGKSSFFL